MSVTQIENGYPKILGHFEYDLNFPDLIETDELMVLVAGQRLLLQPGKTSPLYANFLGWAGSALSELIIELPSDASEGDGFSLCVKSFEGGSRSWILKASSEPPETWFNTGARLDPGSLTVVVALKFANGHWTVEAQQKSLDLDPVPVRVETIVAPIVETGESKVYIVTEESHETQETVVEPINLEHTSQFKLPEQLRDASESARNSNLAGTASNFDVIIDISGKMTDELEKPEKLLQIVKTVQALSANVSPRPICLSMGAQFKVNIAPNEDPEEALKLAIERARTPEHQNGDALEDLLGEYLDAVKPETAVLVVGCSIPFFDVNEVIAQLDREKKQLRFILVQEQAVNVQIGNSPRLLCDLVESSSVPVINRLTRFV